MKRYLVIIFLVLLSIVPNNLFAQTQNNEFAQESIIPYCLYKTQNIWTFLQLETTTGRILIIQFDINGNNRGGVVLNSINLAENEKEVVGRFTLYATSNMYNFILLDQINGKSWQVQWSFKAEERLIIPIVE